jgi:hypothetical protein
VGKFSGEQEGGHSDSTDTIRLSNSGKEVSPGNAKPNIQSVVRAKRMMRKFSLDVKGRREKEGLASEEGATRSSTASDGTEGTQSMSRLKRASTNLMSGMEALNPNASEVFESTKNTEEWCLKRVAKSQTFELAMSVLIFMSTIILAIEAQYAGMQSGYETELGKLTVPAASTWPGAAEAFNFFEWFFGLLFTAELVLKLIGLGCEYFKDPWNALDFLIVAFWLVERGSQEILPMDPKLVRMARLARLLRFVRVVKSIQAFDSLYLIAKAVRSSLSALTWSSVVLLLLEMMMALFLNVMLEDFWTDESKPKEDRQLVFEYFGTFTRALQSMIEMLLGNWYSITRLLTANVSEWYVIFGVSHQLIVGFAVIEVITGVFLHQTFKVANLDDGILVNENKRETKSQTEKMVRFFQHADADGNGELSPSEFRDILGKDKVQEWLGAMGLDVTNVEKVFGLWDMDGDGSLSPEELIAGALQLKGQAKAMDLALLRARVEEIFQMIKPHHLRPSEEGSGLAFDDVDDAVHASLPGYVDHSRRGS